ncbi:MAG: A/G-specific adenine glycosylase [bacterium]
MLPLQNSQFRHQLLGWFAANQRDLPWRRTSNPYFIWVSEVMLQQTQVATVIPYYLRFLDRFPSVDLLAAADLNTVLKLWEGLGYYSRARNMHRAAAMILADHNAQIPDDYDVFRGLPGVGDYIAAAVQSIAFGRAVATVDGNVKRVLSRLFLIEQPVNQSGTRNGFPEAAGKLLDQNRPGDFNQAMMELGALICKPSAPACHICPVQSFCQAFQGNRVDQFPKRLTRKAVPVYHIAVGVVLKKDRLLITLRKPEGLLGGLWEFPGGKTQPGESNRQACIREIREETGLEIEVEQSLTIIRHAYTHFKIMMEVFICRYVAGRVRLNGPVAHRWIHFGQIPQYPFPKANHKAFPLLEKYLQT